MKYKKGFWLWCITVTRAVILVLGHPLCFPSCTVSKSGSFTVTRCKMVTIIMRCHVMGHWSEFWADKMTLLYSFNVSKMHSLVWPCFVAHELTLPLFDGPNGVGTILFLHSIMETVSVSETLFGRGLMMKKCCQHNSLNSLSYFISCFSIIQSQYLRSLCKEVNLTILVFFML